MSSLLGLAARAAARADTSGEVEIEGRSWFLEVHNPPLDLALVGAVHIAQPLAAMAGLAGFGVRVIDPRAAFATEARFPGMTLICDWPDEAFKAHPLGSRSALVVLAHDPKIDDPALASPRLASPAFYIGALGLEKDPCGAAGTAGRAGPARRKPWRASMGRWALPSGPAARPK